MKIEPRLHIKYEVTAYDRFSSIYDEDYHEKSFDTLDQAIKYTKTFDSGYEINVWKTITMDPINIKIEFERNNL